VKRSSGTEIRFSSDDDAGKVKTRKMQRSQRRPRILARLKSMDKKEVEM
jgi:hypothetical protein